jgi:hypothetical protein
LEFVDSYNFSFFLFIQIPLCGLGKKKPLKKKNEDKEEKNIPLRKFDNCNFTNV